MSLALVVRPSLAIFHLVLTRARGTIVYKTLCWLTTSMIINEVFHYPLTQHEVYFQIKSSARAFLRQRESMRSSWSATPAGDRSVTISARPPENLASTRLKSSRRRRNARPTGPVIKACSQLIKTLSFQQENIHCWYYLGFQWYSYDSQNVGKPSITLTTTETYKIH